MSFEVVFSPEAQDDLQRLFDHALERELSSPTCDLDIPTRAVEAIEQACRFLAVSPFSCRKVGSNPFVRELIAPFGTSGFLVLFEIRTASRVHIGAVRHQRESDYH